jgi:hypothetical protein
MITALQAIGTPIPRYLKDAHYELSARGTRQTALLSMFCFWQGEIELGGIPGVVATQAGFIGGSEVVEVQFDSTRLSYTQLLRRAATLRCADRVFPLNPEQRSTAERILGGKRIGTPFGFRADGNTKYHLSKSVYRFLPMTSYQKVLTNIAVFSGEDPEQILSPRQREAIAFINSHPAWAWQDLRRSDNYISDWETVWEQIQRGR